MKKVRYGLAAFGLATAAVGMVAAPVAHAATASSGGRRASRKAVSLRYVVPATPAATTAASSSSGGHSSGGAVSGLATSTKSPGTPANGCTGNTRFGLSKEGYIQGHGWYANGFLDHDTCVGTVFVSLYFNAGTAGKPSCKYAHLSISRESDYSPGNLYAKRYKICGTKGQWKHYGFGVHQVWNHAPDSGLLVKAFSTYGASTARRLGS